MTQLVPQWLARRPAGTVASCTIVVVLTAYFFSIFGALRWNGYPYESWDEVAGYNAALVVRGEHTTRAHFYGTLDLAKFVFADIFFTRFDRYGLAHERSHFSNNVPDSLRDRQVFFGPNYWRPQGLGAIEYVYFRGIQDHLPLFHARAVSIGMCLALFLAVGLFAACRLGWRSLIVTLFAAGYLSPPAYADQFYYALPNGFNGLAIAAILLLLLFYLQAPSRSLRLAIGALFAVAVNSKFDACAFALPIFVGVSTAHWQDTARGRALAMAYAESVAAFLVCLWATNPYLWFDPLLQFQLKVKFLSGVGIGAPPVLKNLGVLNDFIDAVVFRSYFSSTRPGGILTFAPSAALAGFIALTAAGLGFLPAAKRHARLGMLVSYALFLGVAIGVPVFLSNSIYPRYFLPAFAILLLGSAYTATQLLPAAHRAAGWGVRAVCVLVLLFTLTSVDKLRATARSVELGRASHQGLSPEHNRNQAVLHVCAQLTSNGKGLVLIDQHSYTDLRFFREHGVTVRYVNMYNFRETLAEAAGHDPVFIIYAKGDLDGLPDWMGKWRPEDKARYGEYISRLQALPEVKRFPGRTMLLLDWAPVIPSDEIRVARLSTFP